MALSEAVANIAANYRFHWSVRGGLSQRLAYLTAYYFIYIVFRWGDRHLRCLDWLKASGLSDLPVDVETPEGLRLRVDLHTAFDPLYSIVGERDSEEESEGLKELFEEFRYDRRDLRCLTYAAPRPRGIRPPGGG